MPLDKYLSLINNVNTMVNVNNWADYQAAYAAFLRNSKYGDNTVKSYLSDLRHYQLWVEDHQQSNSSLEKILSYKALQQYADDMALSGDHTSGINRRLAALRQFSAFALDQGWIEENGAAKIMNRKEAEDADRILKQYGEYLKEHGNSLRTIKGYLGDIGEFLTVINSI